MSLPRRTYLVEHLKLFATFNRVRELVEILFPGGPYPCFVLDT